MPFPRIRENWNLILPPTRNKRCIRFILHFENSNSGKKHCSFNGNWENKAENFSQIWRLLKQIKFILKSKQTKLNLPTFCYFWPKKSLLTLFKTLISHKLLGLELQNKFNLIKNKLLEFTQFSLYRL